MFHVEIFSIVFLTLVKKLGCSFWFFFELSQSISRLNEIFQKKAIRNLKYFEV